MESNPQPSGICQRFFRVVFGALRHVFALPAPPTRPINVEDSEIVVEFNHSVRAKDDVILSDEQNKHDRDKEQRGKTSASSKGSERKEEAATAVPVHEQATMAMDDEDDTKTRRHWPLLSVASNINEKSEAFIERKKKAMGRNYSLDQDRTK